MHPDLVNQLTKALSDVEHALSQHTDEWHVNRRELCAMWKHVINTAPPPIVVIAARQIAHYFHPKAEIGIHPELHGEVEVLALGLMSDELYRSNEASIAAHTLRRAEREGDPT
jgi:hypothetical protein